MRNKGRFRRASAALLTCLVLLSMVPMETFAASGSLTMVNMDEYPYTFSSAYPSPFAGISRSRACSFWFQGSPAYCIEFGHPTSAGMGYTSASDWSGLSAGDKYTLNLILSYGFTGGTKYGGSINQEYWATQVLIWQVIAGTVNTGSEAGINSVFFRSDAGAQNVYNAIKANVFGANRIPSFCSSTSGAANTYELHYDQATGLYAIELTDTNNVLSSFTFQKGGYGIARNGNILKITSASPAELETFSAAKELYGAAPGALLFWISGTGGYQTMASFVSGGSVNAVTASFRLKVAAGNIEIVKETEDGKNKGGIRFTVSGSNGIELTAETDETGRALFSGLPAGVRYTITEDPGSHHPKYVTADPVTVLVNAGETKHVEVFNRIKKGCIAVTKFRPGAEDPAIKEPMEGVVFHITSDETGERTDIITDATGHAVSPLLPYGEYTVEEEYVEGYDILTPFKVDIDTDLKTYAYLIENNVYECGLRIEKRDSETGNIIPVSGAKFKVKDENGEYVRQKVMYPAETEIDTFVTCEDGTVTLPENLTYGTYTLTEIEAPFGYRLNEEEVSFSVTPLNETDLLTVVMKDEPVKGRIRIYKKGEMFTRFNTEETEFGTLYVPVLEESYLSGAEFLITADEDIITPEGTVRADRGDPVDTICTDASGAAESVYLYPGRYRITEMTAPYGYVPDYTERYVTVSPDNTAEEVIEVAVSNDRYRTEFSFMKEMESGTGTDSRPYQSVVFGLFAEEDITLSGGSAIPAGSLMDLVTPDGEGLCKGNLDLPAGKYEIRELKTADGYLLNDLVLHFEVSADNLEPVTRLDLTEDGSVLNFMKRGTVVLTKRDAETEKPLKGASFELYTERGVLLGTYITGEDGTIRVDNLTYGGYFFTETRAPDGYRMKEDNYSFFISEDGQEISITAYNSKITVPNTGDTKNPAVFLCISAVSVILAGGCACTVYVRKRRRR